MANKMTERAGAVDLVDFDDALRAAIRDGGSAMDGDAFDQRGEKWIIGPGTENGPKEQDEATAIVRDLRKRQGFADFTE